VKTKKDEKSYFSLSARFISCTLRSETLTVLWLRTQGKQQSKQPPNSMDLETLTVTQIVNKFRSFYATHRFITVYTRARHWFLSWAWQIHSTSHLISL